jgi:uncharacterized protein (TIRG00374 family)
MPSSGTLGCGEDGLIQAYPPQKVERRFGTKLHVQSGAVGILIGLACVAILLRQVDLRESWTTLGRLNGTFLLIPLAVFFLNLPLRAWRWQLIFPPSARPGLWSCLTVLGIGNMANFLLPGRAGDVARCVLVGQTSSLNDSSRALATLAVEKVLDGLALIGMVLFSFGVLHATQWVSKLLLVAACIFGGALVLLVVLRYRTASLIRFVRGTLRRVHLSSLEARFDALSTSFADGLIAVGSARQILILLTFTGAIWTTEAAFIWGVAKALSLGVTLKSAVVASAMIGLGFMIPAAPGGLGSYELFGTEAFKLTGLAASSALTLTVMIHALVSVVNVVAGMCLLGIKGISIAELRNRLERDGVTELAETELADRRSA